LSYLNKLAFSRDELLAVGVRDVSCCGVVKAARRLIIGKNAPSAALPR
jgi:hypothetical protein